MKKNLRSPFFYVGDKYKLMPQLIELFPLNINHYYEPFLGGGSSMLYVDSKKYVLNDIDRYIIMLHEYITSFSNNECKLFEILKSTIVKYSLSCSYLGVLVPDEIKKKYKKTYYAKHNKESYLKMRKNFNEFNKMEELYLLVIYGFNRMIRFNSKGEFNVPVGNVDFNNNVVSALRDYLAFMKEKEVEFHCLDYIEFVREINFKEGDFIYFDPPYLISNSEYNKLWSEEDDKNLFELLDELNEKKVNFGISNIVQHKGRRNNELEKWMRKYFVYNVKSNYISRFDNSIKEDSKEVYITNYEKN